MHLRFAMTRNSDVAFMAYALLAGKLDLGGYRFEQIDAEPDALDDQALRGTYELTSLSIHAYALVADKYALLPSGMSLTAGPGPVVVARTPLALDDLAGRRIAVSGETTTGYLLLQLLLGDDQFTPRVVLAEEVIDELASGRAEAALLEHEGQISYPTLGFSLVIDLGEWWSDLTSRPLPVRAVGARRDLAPEVVRDAARLLRESVEYAFTHRDEALAFARNYAATANGDPVPAYVERYVGKWSLDCGEQGHRAVEKVIGRAAAADLVPVLPAGVAIGA